MKKTQTTTTKPTLPDENIFVIPTAWKNKAHPRRGGTYIPDSHIDQRKELKKLAAKAKAGEVTMPEGKPETWSPEIIAQLAGNIMTEVYARSGYGSLLNLVTATKGLRASLQLMVKNPQFTKGGRSGCPGLRTLRQSLAICSSADYAWAREFLEELLEGNRKLIHFCAYLMPTEAGWFEEARTADPYGLLLGFCPPTPAAVESSVRLLRTSRDLAEYLTTEFGVEALPLLLKMYQRAETLPEKKQVVGALIHLPYDQVVEALFDRWSEKPVLALLPKLFANFPQRCIRLGARRPELQSQVATWMSRHPEAAETVMQVADPELYSVLESLQSPAEPDHSEADGSSLHPLFTNPPWLRPRSNTKPPVAKLTIQRPPLRVVFTAKESILAKRVGIRSKRLKNNGDHDLYVSIPWDWFPNLLGVYLYGNQTNRARALERIYECTWPKQDALELGIGLLDHDPNTAAEIFAKAVCRSPHLMAPMVALAAPVSADHFLNCSTTKQGRPHLLAWLNRHPEYAAQSWLPLAAGSNKKQRVNAERCLRMLVHQGHEAVLRKVAEQAGAKAGTVVDALLASDPLMDLPKKVPVDIGFVNLPALPRPRLLKGDQVLPKSALETLIQVLAISNLDVPYHGISVVKEELEPTSLAALAWALFQQWLQTGANAKHLWTLTALGHVGDDDIASRLAPLVRAWPGESQHTRAVVGLDVLLAIGTELALMHLVAISQAVKFKGIKTKARERIEQLAESLVLTREQLADRLIPNLDLAADGTMILDFGARQFTVSFDEKLKPVITDSQGSPYKTLPNPGGKDDAEAASAAEAKFKLLKKNLRTLAKTQISRFNQATVTGRRWHVDAFKTYLVAHPLMNHLVRRMVWAVYGKDGSVLSFRVDANGRTVNHLGKAWNLPKDSSIGVVHPADLEPEVLTRWRECFAQEQLVQPVAQLKRPSHSLTEAERSMSVLRRGSGQRVPAGKVLGLLKRGWEKAELEDEGRLYALVLPLPDDAHEARLCLGGLGLEMGLGADQIEDPTFDQLLIVPRGASDNVGDEILLGDLPVGLASELIDAVTYLTE